MERSYGVIKETKNKSAIDALIEQINIKGYAILDAGFDSRNLKKIKNTLKEDTKKYQSEYSLNFLKNIDEHNTLRAPIIRNKIYFDICLNKHLIKLLDKLFVGKYILNQQNGIFNPANEDYNQAYWHRDLPYQHFTSSMPLSINAIFCVDDFTKINGSTWVIPGSHLFDNFPSNEYINNNKIQIEAKSGQYIVINSMVYHSGGFNKSNNTRRGINNVYTIPFIKQQIEFSKNDFNYKLSKKESDLLGINLSTPKSIESYLNNRPKKK